MNKPWDNESSSEADRSWMYSPSFDADTKVVSHEKFANLERRLRHAERLLESARNQIDNIGVHIPMDADTWDCICDHLEAARQEDGR